MAVIMISELWETLNRYAHDHDLIFSADAYFYAADNSFALVHVYTAEDGEIKVDYLKM